MALYTIEILRLASSLVAGDKLANPDGVAEKRSPICGSHITAEVKLDQDRITHLAIRASACAMGQASAAIVRSQALGTSLTELASLRAGLVAYLSGDGELPSTWPELALLAAAKDYPARHAAILLPFDAVLAAAEVAQQANAA
jgi:NifU-like protein involved in Fe-S cluster formation